MRQYALSRLRAANSSPTALTRPTRSGGPLPPTRRAHGGEPPGNPTRAGSRWRACFYLPTHASLAPFNGRARASCQGPKRGGQYVSNEKRARTAATAHPMANAIVPDANQRVGDQARLCDADCRQEGEKMTALFDEDVLLCLAQQLSFEPHEREIQGLSDTLSPTSTVLQTSTVAILALRLGAARTRGAPALATDPVRRTFAAIPDVLARERGPRDGSWFRIAPWSASSSAPGSSPRSSLSWVRARR